MVANTITAKSSMSTGPLRIESDYVLETLGRAAKQEELRYRYVSGRDILLQEGLVLTPVTSSGIAAPF